MKLVEYYRYKYNLDCIRQCRCKSKANKINKNYNNKKIINKINILKQ